MEVSCRTSIWFQASIWLRLQVLSGFQRQSSPDTHTHLILYNCVCVCVCVCACRSAAKSLQSCPTLCDAIDGSPPDSPVPGILQARTLEWVAIYFLQCVKVKSLSRVRLLATPWTAAHQASPSLGFSRQEYWSGVPLPSPTKIMANYLIKLLSLIHEQSM